jgi:hypothetical protein
METEFSKAQADAFIAKVDAPGASAGEWLVTPQIIEMTGVQHAQITVGTSQGIKPAIGDSVLILTMRNNLDFANVSRYFEANEANGVIVGVVAASAFENVGAFTITGSLKVGDGSQKMVRGDDLQAFCEDVLDVLQQVVTWAGTGVAPGPTGGIAPLTGVVVPSFPADVLSETNSLE